MTTYIAIDPGLTGAVAVNSGGDWSLYDCPVLEHKVGKSKKKTPDPYMMSAILRDHKEGAHAYLEKVGAMPGQGVTSMFNFGMGYGMWQGILAALEIPYTLVTPQRWKKALMSGMGKEKDASRIRVRQLLPDLAQYIPLKKHNGRADAILIAEYARQTHQGGSHDL